MKTVTKINSGNRVYDDEMNVEYVYCGDYDENIITQNLSVFISAQKGCSMKCDFCGCPKDGFYGNCSFAELVSQITDSISSSAIKHGKSLDVHFVWKGEPTLNPDVIKAATTIGTMVKPGNRVSFDEYNAVVSTMMPKCNKHLEEFLQEWVKHGFGVQFSINTLNEKERNKMFRNGSLSLWEIADIIQRLPAPKKGKYILNFAVTMSSDLNPDLMAQFFDKEKCLVQITPIRETRHGDLGYELVENLDIFRRPLLDAGWEIIAPPY